MSFRDFVPMIFANSQGELYSTRFHDANFGEKHNASKAKCLLILYHHKHKLGHKYGLSVAELSQASGVSYSYVKARVRFWLQWGYIHRKVKLSGVRPTFTYTIAKRGTHLLEDILPEFWLQYYVAQIKAYRARRCG